MKFLLILLFIPIAFNAQIVNIPDANFKNALVNESVAIINGTGGLQDADTNNDGEIQLNEALAVTELQIQSQNINSLEGLESFENLVKLLCFNNNLTEINLSQNVLLIELWVNQNSLSALDVTMLQNLDWLSSSDNLFTGIDVSQNPNLRIFRTSRNQIIEIDVSNNIHLEQFWCSDNLVSTLNLSNNLAITDFTGKGNPQLVSLNVQNGNNINMTRMWAHDNPNLDCILVDDENASYPSCELSNNTGWCKDFNATYSENASSCSLGISKFPSTQMKIYPNPTNKFINILTNESIKLIRIYSISGQKVIETNKKSIDISKLKDGAYFMIILNDQNQKTFKKVVKSNN